MNWRDDLSGQGESFLGFEHQPTETQAVDADRFDHAFWLDVESQVPPLRRMMSALRETHDYTDEFMEDLFQAAFKALPEIRDPQAMKPTHVPNQAMVSELSGTEQFQKMRTDTRGDEYGATMALLSMEEHIRKIQDAMEDAKDKAQEAQDLLEGLPGLDPNAQGPTPDPNALPESYTAAQQALQQAQQAAQGAAAQVKDTMRLAAQKAATERTEENDLMAGFGAEDGDLQKMPFEERRQLAQRLRNNRLAQFVKLLGQFKMVQQGASRRKVLHATDEVVGVRLGNNLQRIIPAEMLNLATPELEDDFWLRYANAELLEYDLRGKEKMGQGPVIAVVDESGSMAENYVMGGTREAWSKALTLALADQARQKNRDFIYIGFSSINQQWTLRFPGGRTPITDVITMTEHFYKGGTHFERPLRMALQIVEEDYNDGAKPKPDIVFITDDQVAGLDATFMHEWNRVKDKVDIRCFGIALGCGYAGALAQVSDNVRSIMDLTESDPAAVAELFRVI